MANFVSFTKQWIENNSEGVFSPLDGHISTRYMVFNFSTTIISGKKSYLDSYRIVASTNTSRLVTPHVTN